MATKIWTKERLQYISENCSLSNAELSTGNIIQVAKLKVDALKFLDRSNGLDMRNEFGIAGLLKQEKKESKE